MDVSGHHAPAVKGGVPVGLGSAIGPLEEAVVGHEVGETFNDQLLAAADHDRFVIVSYQATSKRTKEELSSFNLQLHVTVGSIENVPVESWVKHVAPPYTLITWITEEESFTLLLPKGSPLKASGDTTKGGGVFKVFTAALN